MGAYSSSQHDSANIIGGWIFIFFFPLVDIHEIWIWLDFQVIFERLRFSAISPLLRNANDPEIIYFQCGHCSCLWVCLFWDTPLPSFSSAPPVIMVCLVMWFELFFWGEPFTVTPHVILSSRLWLHTEVKCCLSHYQQHKRCAEI